MTWFERILDLVFVPTCVSCGIRLDHGVLCDTCRALYEERKEKICGACGLRYTECRCIGDPILRAGASDHVKIFSYDPLEPNMPESRMLYTMKRNHHKPLADFLADELVSALSSRLPDGNIVVTYMPRGKKARSEYGIDQSELLARRLAKRLSLGFFALFVRREEGEQKALNKRERLMHAARSFRLKKGTTLRGTHIVLLDDIATSGATLAVGTKLLKKAGAESVTVVTLAVVTNASHSAKR